MGKLRKEKKYKIHSNALPLPSHRTNVGVGSTERARGQEVVPPIPPEIMQSLPVVKLVAGGEGGGARGEGKKDKRGTKREKLLKSMTYVLEQ